MAKRKWQMRSDCKENWSQKWTHTKPINTKKKYFTDFLPTFSPFHTHTSLLARLLFGTGTAESSCHHCLFLHHLRKLYHLPLWDKKNSLVGRLHTIIASWISPKDSELLCSNFLWRAVVLNVRDYFFLFGIILNHARKVHDVLAIQR